MGNNHFTKSPSLLRILILGNMAPYRIGGAEVQVRRLGEAFARRGHSITVAGHANVDATISVAGDKDLFFQSRCLPILRFNRTTRAVTYLFSVFKLLLRQRKKIDIVLPMILSEAALSTALLKNVGLISIPSVVSTQGSGKTGDAAFLAALPGRGFWIGVLNRGTTAINYLSPTIEKELKRIGLRCLIEKRIPNGMPVIREPNTNRHRFDGTRSFLFAGRLIPQKGLFDLLHAVTLICRKGYPIKLNIVGDGPSAGELKEQVHRMSLEKIVSFHGRIAPEEMSHHYRSNNILILPSLYEGHPLVLNEAMSHGLPVIVTRSGGPEFFVENSMGIICSPGDIKGLAAAMIAMIRMPEEKLREMGEAGRGKVEQYCDIEVVADQFLELFAQLRADVKRSLPRNYDA